MLGTSQARYCPLLGKGGKLPVFSPPSKSGFPSPHHHDKEALDYEKSKQRLS
jgi:hypothetical protein